MGLPPTSNFWAFWVFGQTGSPSTNSHERAPWSTNIPGPLIMCLVTLGVLSGYVVMARGIATTLPSVHRSQKPSTTSCSVLYMFERRSLGFSLPHRTVAFVPVRVQLLANWWLQARKQVQKAQEKVSAPWLCWLPGPIGKNVTPASLTMLLYNQSYSHKRYGLRQTWWKQDFKACTISGWQFSCLCNLIR